MTSIAAFISILAGGAPQDPLPAPANPAGTGGLFTALLTETGAPAVAEGEIAANPTPINSFAVPDGQATIEVTAGDAELRQALTEGLELPRGGAEINATIIDSPDSANISPTVTLAPAAPQIPEGLISKAVPDAPAPNITTLQPAADQSAAPKPGQNTTQPVQSTQLAPDVQAAPETKPHDQALVDVATRATGLENAQTKAAQTARDNGLANAVVRTAQPTQKAETQSPAPVLSDDKTIGKGAFAPGAGTDENLLAAKTETDRPEFTSRRPKIIQQPIKPGSGQTLIKFQQLTGADPSGVSSPPTLTVNVQTHTASPSPAPANVPHVPVSALAVHIAQQASQGARRFDIRLDPPELGRIEVRLEVSREGQVTTHLVVERSETLDLLQRDARQLERALQDAGLNTSKEDMKFSLKDQDLAQDGGDGNANSENEPESFSGGSDDDLSLIPDDAMPPPTRYIASTGLDIRI